ncbi:transcriptional regulator [Iodidimonas muriae]|uniref:Transcriptional regulator n=1 Tax=Iodidimonas muriae TaxID=261467 RepID=A0ABQ2LEY1_9PROT|nr:metalloregulator ArsR/SmtB family transcription factor [Iodidimonas muriae]GER07293.1 transcriptional regulator [Kordiimonadales bacterium JCM 17843]GGO11084.1 transcriptional regulator [Iodidimonas muriae]
MVDNSVDLDAVFKALGDPTRRAMLASLKAGPATVGNLAAPHAMTLAGASKHIQVLEQAGLIRCARKGRERLCALEPDPLRAAERWLNHYAAFWSDRLDALEMALGKTEKD